MSTKKTIQLSHGGGGKEMDQLIHELFFKAFDNPILTAQEDAATLNMCGHIAFTTDSFTVSPLFFAGGDIGKLAIAGTVNDLAMMAAQPEYLSCSFIIEEGFPLDDLKTIVNSMATELRKSGARIVCGDTKVVPKGCADGLFINTSGVGPILMARDGLTLESELHSDCDTLWPIIEQLLVANINIHAMRDATRGGLSAVLNEWAKASQIGINVDEASIPICDEVKGLCELFGFEPFDLANEGTFIMALPMDVAEGAIEVMQRYGHCEHAAIIGQVTDGHPGKVVLQTPWGSSRYLDLPQGELLPRIC